MKNKKAKKLILIVVIIVFLVLMRQYIHNIGEYEYNMSIYVNPIVALRLVIPNLVVGLLIYKLSIMVAESNPNRGKLLKIISGLCLLEAALGEAISIIVFVVRFFKGLGA